MENLKNIIGAIYAKELKELSLLDKIMLLDTDYSRYNSLINEKAADLVEKIMSNKLQFNTCLKKISTMSEQYYNDLLDYEKELINDEIEEALFNLVIEMTEEAYSFI